ncbi:MAG: hypothetical protein IPI72_17785 [Flavobacteriales bacterium]|nr:hypothetical protein [Flavobacteriales bacterium]
MKYGIRAWGSAAFSNWDEYYLYRDEQDQYDQGYMVEDYQAYYSYQYCQWRQVVTIGGGPRAY